MIEIIIVRQYLTLNQIYVLKCKFSLDIIHSGVELQNKMYYKVKLRKKMK